jgi:hypothetical protein
VSKNENLDCNGNKPRFFCLICRSPLYHVELAQEWSVCSGRCKDELTRAGMKHLQSAKSKTN